MSSLWGTRGQRKKSEQGTTNILGERRVLYLKRTAAAIIDKAEHTDIDR